MKAQLNLKKGKTASDGAIDGLFAGLIAGIIMLLFLILAGLLIGEEPDSLLMRFATRQSSNPLTGGLVHLAVSGIYGVVFSLLIHALPNRLLDHLPGWLAGLIYSGVLLLLAMNLILPGLKSSLQELPLQVLAAGHAVYGVILGWRI